MKGVMTREQCIEFMSDKCSGLGDAFGSEDTHPFWIPETVFRRRAQRFIVVRPLQFGAESYNDYQFYWAWCKENLESHVMCYYSDTTNMEELWGFCGPESDVTLWILKWAT